MWLHSLHVMHFEWFVNLYNRACWLVSKYIWTTRILLVLIYYIKWQRSCNLRLTSINVLKATLYAVHLSLTIFSNWIDRQQIAYVKIKHTWKRQDYEINMDYLAWYVIIITGFRWSLYCAKLIFEYVFYLCNLNVLYRLFNKTKCFHWRRLW